MNKKVSALLSSCTPEVRSLALQARELILKVIPTIEEQVDSSAKIIGYGFGPRYADLLCVIMPQKFHVNLGFYKGTELPDPVGLLEGTGKVHRHVKLKMPAEIKSSALKKLLKAALIAHKKRAASSG